MYKWVPANLTLGVCMRWTSISDPSRGQFNNYSNGRYAPACRLELTLKLIRNDLFILAKAQKEAYERKEKEKAKQAKTQVRNILCNYDRVSKFSGRIIFRVLTIWNQGIACVAAALSTKTSSRCVAVDDRVLSPVVTQVTFIASGPLKSSQLWDRDFPFLPELQFSHHQSTYM